MIWSDVGIRGSAAGGGRSVGGLVTHRYLLVIVVGLMLFHLYDLQRSSAPSSPRGCCTKRPRPVRSGPLRPRQGWSGRCYAVSRHRGRGAGWVLGGVAGTVFLALGWIPVNLPTMIVAVFLFSVTNVGARLVLTRWRRN